MNTVCIIDTSVFLNILDVPGKNQNKNAANQAFNDYVELNATFILPMATIIETGNHIAQNGDGATRRKTAERFCKAVKSTFNGEAPWKPNAFPNANDIMTWIDRFPEHAGRNKTHKKTTEGTSFGDLSIIEEFNKCVKRFPMYEVFIWSLDSDLIQYHHTPNRL